jgi:hypothetical protein
MDGDSGGTEPAQPTRGACQADLTWRCCNLQVWISLNRLEGESMSYRETVTQKVGGGPRSTERQELWGKLAEAYDQGGPEAVAKKLAELADSSKKAFDQALKQLENTL